MKILYFFFLFMSGACLASFGCLIGMRIPASRSIIVPRSHCDNCQEFLKWYELIPVFSYLFSLGKCTHCHVRISFFLPLQELLFGGSFAYIFTSKLDSPFRLILLFLLLLFSTMDYFYEIIMPIFFLPGFFILLFVHPNINLVNFLMFFICLVSLSWLTHGLGFGDVEIFSFLALFLSIKDCLSIILISCFLCLTIELCKHNIYGPMRFVPYIYLATILVLLWT